MIFVDSNNQKIYVLNHMPKEYGVGDSVYTFLSSGCYSGKDRLSISIKEVKVVRNKKFYHLILSSEIQKY